MGFFTFFQTENKILFHGQNEQKFRKAATLLLWAGKIPRVEYKPTPTPIVNSVRDTNYQ